MRLSAQRTHLSREHAIDAFARAHRAVLGRDVDGPTLACIVAQSALETGHWKSCRRFNLKNIKSPDPRTGLYCMFPCGEELTLQRAQLAVRTANPREDGGGPDAAIVRRYTSSSGVEMASCKFWPTHPQTIFRAYRSAAEGAADAIRFLAVDTTPGNGKPNRYAKAWQAAEDDDPERFSRELGAAGFYTANVDRYTQTLMLLFKQYLPECQAYVALMGPREPEEAEEPSKTIDAGHVLSVVADTLATQSRDPSIYDAEDDSVPPTDRNT